ncbi:MAG: hypothetical protein ACRDZR_08925, partial [Acidimicrobiales bacterium]
TKAAALASKRTESALVEEALRAYLRSGHAEAARGALGTLLARVAASSDLSEDAALAQAVDDVHAVRHDRRSATASGG